MESQQNKISMKFELQWKRHETNGLVQDRRNSIANALELRLSCTNPSKWAFAFDKYGKLTWLDWLTYLQAWSGLILGLHSANERQRYIVTMSLIGWVQA